MTAKEKIKNLVLLKEQFIQKELTAMRLPCPDYIIEEDLVEIDSWTDDFCAKILDNMREKIDAASYRFAFCAPPDSFSCPWCVRTDKLSCLDCGYGKRHLICVDNTQSTYLRLRCLLGGTIHEIPGLFGEIEKILKTVKHWATLK